MQILLALNWEGAIKPHPFWGVRREGRDSNANTARTYLGRGSKASPPFGDEVRGQGQ